ncbi:MAG: phosphatase PAP2 family protein [Romboutsia sp.]|nr:phosphatase PAP2 family protein [Romboutsia sp.]
MIISSYFYNLSLFKNKYLKITLITLLSILIFMIGCSRIYLGVHYTSDVLAGFSLSIA